jgi:hypothetical protein
MTTPAGDAGLRLALTVPERSGLGEVLVGLVTLTNEGGDAVDVNGRFTLAEGDLDVTVTGAGGTSRAGWPWPADSGARTVTLRPGESLETGVLLLCDASSRPLFPAAGRYTLVAGYLVAPGVTVTSEQVTVARTEPTTDHARDARRVLLDRDVIQSLAAAGTLGAAGPALADLAAHGTGETALLATLAGGVQALDAVGAADPLTAATAVTAVLLPGDDRRDAVGAQLDLARDARADAMIRAVPAR